MKIFGYEEKTGRSGQVCDVQHVHMYIGNVYMKLRGGFIPYCNALSLLDYKRREGSLLKKLPILS
mgnify:CR=1 FL=1